MGKVVNIVVSNNDKFSHENVNNLTYRLHFFNTETAHNNALHKILSFAFLIIIYASF